MAGKVDLEEMQRYREENKHDNQGLFTFDEGDTVLYICQPCDDDATLCFVDMKQHKIAQDKPPVVCLDPEKNKILTHPRVVDYLGEDGKDIDGGCPICEAILGGTFDGDVKKAKAKTASLWNFVPIKYRKDARMPWDKRPFEVRQCAASYTVSDGIFDVFGNEGDISDPERAIFVRVQRKGTKMNDTEYTVHTDSETLRKPVRFTDEQRAIIDEALAPGGVGDLYRIVAAFTKSRADVVELLGGGGLEEETRPGKTPAGYNKGGGNKPAMSSPKPSSPKSSTPPPKGKKHQAAASQDEEAPPCFEVDCTPTDAECQGCAFKEPCAEACGVEVPADRIAAKSAKPAGKVAPPKAAAPAKPQKGKKVEEEDEEVDAAADADDEDAGDFIKVSDAELDTSYLLPNGSIGVFKGTSKNKGFFETGDGKRIVVAVAELVSPHVDEAGANGDEDEPELAASEEEEASEDDTLDEMEQMLAQKQKTLTTKGAKANGKAARP